MSCAAFIPARGGSTRVPRKNLADVGGRSLLRRAIDCAHEAGLAPIVVSTEDQEIAGVAAALGAEVHARPASLATATAQIEMAMLHWLARAPVDVESIALLQPTSPFRTAATLRRCVELLGDGVDSVVTATQDARRAFFWGRIRGEHRVVWDRDGASRPRTQDVVHDIAVENGCVYVTRRAHLMQTRSRMGGHERAIVIDSVEAWDIDTPEDLVIARAIAEAMGR